MKRWHEVATLDQLERDGVAVARIAGREIGVLLDSASGLPHAVRNRCPHMGAPICLGTVREREEGRAGHYRRDGQRVLHCPWHGWEFDLATGQCPEDPKMRVAVYPVRVEDGRVLVEA